MDKRLKDLRAKSYSKKVWDDIDLPYKEDYNDVIGQAVDFFKTESKLVYPAKSFFVAIVYAKCMEKWFGVDFITALSDKELLPDDKFYIPYRWARYVYDSIILAIGDIWQYKSIAKTVSYFKQEFCIETC